MLLQVAGQLCHVIPMFTTLPTMPPYVWKRSHIVITISLRLGSLLG